MRRTKSLVVPNSNRFWRGILLSVLGLSLGYIQEYGSCLAVNEPLTNQRLVSR